jgi:hypothetical protein
MDGRGAWRDNVCVERFWRAIKDAQAYRAPIESIGEARQSISRHLAFDDARRPTKLLLAHRRSSPLQPAAAPRARTGAPPSDAEAFVQERGHRLRCMATALVLEKPQLYGQRAAAGSIGAEIRAAGPLRLETEPVQGFLAGMSTIGACDGRCTGLGIGAATARGGGSEFL